MKESIVSGFELLGIKETDYPCYTDPVSFAGRFEKCSIVDDIEITTTSETVAEQKTNVNKA